MWRSRLVSLLKLSNGRLEKTVNIAGFRYSNPSLSVSTSCILLCDCLSSLVPLFNDRLGGRLLAAETSPPHSQLPNIQRE